MCDLASLDKSPERYRQRYCYCCTFANVSNSSRWISEIPRPRRTLSTQADASWIQYAAHSIYNVVNASRLLLTGQIDWSAVLSSKLPTKRRLSPPLAVPYELLCRIGAVTATFHSLSATSQCPAFRHVNTSFDLVVQGKLYRVKFDEVLIFCKLVVMTSISLQAARGVVGRLMADPAFMQKLVIEEMVTAVLSVVYESQQRGDRFLKELDLVALNTLSLMGATGAMVWLTAPNRSYGAVHKFPWQNMLHNLPNHVFDASTPYRRFSLASRVGSLAAKVKILDASLSFQGYCTQWLTPSGFCF